MDAFQPQPLASLAPKVSAATPDYEPLSTELLSLHLLQYFFNNLETHGPTLAGARSIPASIKRLEISSEAVQALGLGYRLQHSVEWNEIALVFIDQFGIIHERSRENRNPLLQIQSAVVELLALDFLTKQVILNAAGEVYYRPLGRILEPRDTLSADRGESEPFILPVRGPLVPLYLAVRAEVNRFHQNLRGVCSRILVDAVEKAVAAAPPEDQPAIKEDLNWIFELHTAKWPLVKAMCRLLKDKAVLFSVLLESRKLEELTSEITEQVGRSLQALGQPTTDFSQAYRQWKAMTSPEAVNRLVQPHPECFSSLPGLKCFVSTFSGTSIFLSEENQEFLASYLHQAVLDDLALRSVRETPALSRAFADLRHPGERGIKGYFREIDLAKLLLAVGPETAARLLQQTAAEDREDLITTTLDLLDYGVVFSDQVTAEEISNQVYLALQNSFPKPILELFKKACELIDQEGVRGLFTRLLGRFPRGDIAPLALGWVPESERLSPQELKVLVGSIIDRSHARDFCELLPRYQAEKDQLRSDGSIQSIRELKRRVSLIESGLRLEDIPGPLQEITNAPGFDFKALADFLAQAKFQALCDGAFDDRQILAPCVELYPASDVQELLNAALFPGPRRDPRYRAIYRKIKSSLGYIPAKGAQLTTEEQQKVFASLLEFPGIIKNYLKLEVLKKSDPRGWVSGNYTDCCIPFGDPQMTTLMFGPDTQFLIVSLCTPGSSSDRIITQSVIVRRHDDRIDRARPVRYYRRFSDASKEFLEADPGQRTQYALLDNLEMANNYGEYSAAVKQAVLQFCALAADRPRYLGTFFSDIGFPEAVLTESFFGLHQSEVRYMDYNDSYVYALPEKPNNTALREEIVFSSLSRRHLGIVSDIERECYPEIMLRSEQELLEYLSEQQQRFFKLDFVPDGLSSFLVRQGPRSVGYVLMDKAESEVYPEEAVLVISDLAVLPGFRNLKVLRSIFGRVLQAARIHGLSVEFEARNATTMSLIETPFGRRFIQRHGFHLCELGALTDYYPGHDFTRIRLESGDLGRQLMIEWPQGEPMISANLMQEEDEEREW